MKPTPSPMTAAEFLALARSKTLSLDVFHGLLEKVFYQGAIVSGLKTPLRRQIAQTLLENPQVRKWQAGAQSRRERTLFDDLANHAAAEVPAFVEASAEELPNLTHEEELAQRLKGPITPENQRRIQELEAIETETLREPWTKKSVGFESFCSQCNRSIDRGTALWVSPSADYWCEACRTPENSDHQQQLAFLEEKLETAKTKMYRLLQRDPKPEDAIEHAAQLRGYSAAVVALLALINEERAYPMKGGPHA